MAWICVVSTASLLLAVWTVIASSAGQSSAPLWHHLWLLGSALIAAGSFLWMVNQRLVELADDEWNRRLNHKRGEKPQKPEENGRSE